MARPNVYITWGIIAVVIGLIALFVPPIPTAGEEERIFAAYWWIATPALLAGFVLLLVGRRRHLQERYGDEQ